MHSFNQWKPKSATGVANGTRSSNRAKHPVALAFSRFFVVFALMGLTGLLMQGRALAQNTVSITPNVTFYTEGDPNPITGTVSLNTTTPLAGPVTVNIRLAYQTPAAGDVVTSTAVVFAVGEENTAKNFAIDTANDVVNIRQRTVVLTATAGAATDTANITQIDPRGIFLSEVASRTSESDPQTGARTFLDVSLVDPNNPSANLAELTPTGNVFVSILVANATNSEFSDEALIATDDQPIFRQQQVLVFTPQNFQQSQRVYVQGVDDALQDGDQVYRVIVFARDANGNAVNPAVNSTDAEYSGIGTNTGVFNVNLDNESNPGGNRAQVLINSTDGVTPGPTTGLQTNENGSVATFTVVLASAPTADVTINLQTSDPTEGKLLVGTAQVNSTSITFSPDDTAPNGWSTPQTVQVKGQDDTVADGNIDYSIITTVSSLDTNYAAIDPPNVGVTNNDNETAGLTVSPSFLLVFEGQTATISAVLNLRPTSDVRFPIAVTAGVGEVQLNRTEVVFTPANFNVPQTVVVTGVNDNLVDGDQPFTITFRNATSSDPVYNGRFGTTVTGTVVDTNQARVNIQPPGGLTTTEAGGQATFSVSLASRPQTGTTVTINVASSDTTEGTVDKPTLTFTQANWNVPQVVTITGVDDLLRDGNVDYQINLDISGSSDPNFAALQLQPVTVTNNDSGEVSGVTFSALGGLTTTEAGGTATFTVKLNVQPTANVRLNLRSSDLTEGTVSPASLIFTPTNFNTPQTVTVTGVNDLVDDGDTVYNVITDTLITTDSTYQFDPPNVLVTNLDNDTRGINVTPTTGLITNESGTSATFTVVLNSQPTADVTIGISTPFTNEISLDKTSLTFTPTNWNVLQRVTVTGVNDALLDGNRSFVVVTAPATSTDTVYDGLNASDVTGINNDNDVAAVVLSPDPLVVREGESGFVSVTLSAQPTRNVIVPLFLNPTGEVVLDKTQLTFTPQNFNVPQRVKVSSIADGRTDGNQTVTLQAGRTGNATISGDPNFNNLTNSSTINSLDVVAVAGVIISGPNTDIVSENGGIATFNVALRAQPGADVTINVASSDTSEGTVNPSSLTFTPANFNTAQQVTVRGVNDNIDDGNINFTVTFAAPVSADPNYSGLTAQSFAFTNVDNDTAGFLVTPYIGLATTEAGGTATFRVSLTSQPSSSVTTTLSTPFTGEVRFAPASLTFTAADYNVPQTVTVTGLPDGVIDGNRTWVVVTSPATSTDPKYNGLNPSDVTGTNADIDTFSIVLSPSSQLVREGQTVTVSVRLLGTPNANVVVPLAVDPADEVVLDKSQLAFTPANANVPQIVRVTSLSDGVTDGNVVVTLTAGPAISPDARFDGLRKQATITSLDVVANPAIKVVGPTTTVLNETGTTATFDVSLNSRPGSNVTINISSSDLTEGTVNPTSLTFTPATFDTVQTVTMTGVDDSLDDGNVNFNVTISKPVSTDPNYSALASRVITFVNVDNDRAGFTVTDFSGLRTDESGLTDTFTVVLNSQPSANVTINLSTPFTQEIKFAPASLTFTPTNFRTPQTVTVTGLDDTVPDGDRTWVIVTSAAVSTDPQYRGLNPSDVTGTNLDNEAAGYTVAPGFVVVEEGNTSTFTVRLNLKPTAPVRVPISVNRPNNQPAQVSVNTTALIFTPTNFSTPQTVTVTGIDDNLRDGDQPFSINIGNAISSDPAYNAQHARTLNGTCVDTDVPGVSVNAASPLITKEVNGSATFTVALQTSPTAGNTVTINVVPTDTSEVTVTPATLTFDSANFDIPQTVTVRGIDDGIRDGDQNYQILLRIASSSDPDYVNLRVPAISGVNQDNGGAGILITPATGLTTSEDGTTTTFGVQLINSPSSPVTVTLRSSDLSEGVLLGANSQPATNNSLTLTFDSSNFNTPQTVTVQGVDDALVDGDVTYSITSRLTSNDANFNMTGASASIVNTDNDTAGINVSGPAGGFTLAEGSRGTFTVVLTTQPTGKVVVRLASSDASAATVNYSAITFFPNAPVGTAPAGEIFSQWNRPVTVTITAVADGVVDADQNWRINLTRDAAATQDEFYKTVDPADVTGITTNVDLAGVTVTGPVSLTTSESDTKNNAFASFNVSLKAKPQSDVVIPVSSSNREEALINVPGSTVFTPSGSLTFTPANWNVPKLVKVRGVDDTIEDGDKPFTISFGPTISRNSFYNSIVIPTVQGINKDDEDLTAPTVTITSPTDGAILNNLVDIVGTADDAVSTGNGLSSGIKTVQVRLFREFSRGLSQTAGYYNPTTNAYEAPFDETKHFITARYNSATKTFSALLPRVGNPLSLASGTYKVLARAIDNKGNKTDSEEITFVVDSIAPTVKLTSPKAGTFSAPPQVQGEAIDNPGGTGIDETQTYVSLFRAANTSLGNTAGYLEEDGSFSETFGPDNLLPVVPAAPDADGAVTFTFDFPALGAGQYTVQARTQDRAGNIGRSSNVTFTLRNVSGAEDFLIGQTYLFSLPYSNNNTAGATVKPDEAFNVAMFDPVTQDQRYLLSRFNPLTSSYEILDQNALLKRGEGYLIKPLSSNVRILRPIEDDSRIPLAQSIRTWTYTLRRNASASANDPNNGFNLIGDPFNPDFYLAADWQNATFSDGVITKQGVAEAAAAGLVDSRLFTLNSATGAFEPVTGNMEVFKGYFVRTFKDNVTVTVNAIAIQQ